MSDLFVFAHAHKLFDKKLENCILICSFHLSQFLELGDLYHVWILLNIFFSL